MEFRNLAKLNRSSRNAVSASLLVIAGIAMYNWIVAPHTAYLNAAQRYGAVVSNIGKKNKAVANRVRVEKEKLEELRDRFARLQSTLFTTNEAKEFCSSLQDISGETGCSVNSLNFITTGPGSKHEGSENDSGIVADRVVLSVVSVYDNIIRLLERMRERPRKVWIDSLKMESLGGDSAQIKSDMTITIYAIRDEEPKVYE